jgi:hypothetical protein
MFQKLSIWSVISALIAIALARIAVWLQSFGFSPMVVFPLIIGAALGSMIALAANVAQEKRRELVVTGAVLAAIVCAAAEHGFSYLDYRRGYEAKLQSDPKAQLAASMNPENMRPASFAKFMGADAKGNWVLWIVDALAMIGAAAGSAWFVSGDSHRRANGPTDQKTDS